MTKGYKGYAKQFAQGADEMSEFVAQAQGFTDSQAARESKQYVAALAALENSASEDEFLESMAKYLTPSSRLMLVTKAEFAAVRELENVWKVTKAYNYIGVGIKGAGRTVLAGAMKGIERVAGDAMATGMMVAFGVIGGAAADALMFYFGPELMLLELEYHIAKEFFRDGMTLKFLDDVLSHFYLSLEMFSPALKLQEYKEFSSVAGTSSEPQLKLMYYDSVELATVIDFWGDEYIKLMQKDGHKYPKYKKLRPFRAIMRVPGKYINLHHHPNESEEEIQQCQEIEAMLDLNVGSDHAFYSRSQVNAWFPKKPGMVRNLRDFPVYDQTMQWPDTNKGIPVQQGGYFSEQDLDPTIVKLFKLWATAGTYGPAYNRSPSRRIRFAAVEANKADLQQWLNPNINSPLAWTEINNWVNSLSGLKGIMLSDMVKLAPKQWLHEWNTDLPIDTKTWVFKQNASRKFMTTVGYDQFTSVVGRHTFHPRDRLFLENASKGKVLGVSNYNNSQFLHTPVEIYPSSLDGSQGLYAYYRKARPGETEKYRKILREGEDWKAFLDSQSAATDEKWRRYLLEQIWGDYIRTEKPVRTVWSYITRHRQFFIEELQYVCNTMAGKNRAKVWERYSKLIAGTHVPLQMDSIHRVTFMGMFAALAYPEVASKDTQFLHQIEKKFGAIKENILITTDKGWKNNHWAHNLSNVIIESKRDFPVMFGELNVRIFVLDKPRVMVVATKGTTSAAEWTIDLDFTASEFVTHEVDKQANRLNVQDVPTDTKASTTDLIGADGYMSVHRGFLRAMRALQPGVVDTMNAMFKKYSITEVFMTGHSLGAAVTQLLAMVVPRVPIRDSMSRLKNAGGVAGYKNPNAYMFSSPAVGDERFARRFSHSTGESAQVWIDGDVIAMSPPFLFPDSSKWPAAYNEVMGSYAVLIEGKGGGFAAFLWVLHELYKHSKLPSFLDGTQLFKDFSTFDKRKLKMLLDELSDAANENRVVRGGQVFFRMGGKHKQDFIESAYDTGNSVSLLYQLVTTPNIRKHLEELHKIENVVATLSLAAKQHPDLFDIDAEDLPSWADGGTVDPYNPDNKPAADKDMQRIAKLLKEGKAHIIGYGKTKHHHRPWSFVDKGDLVQGSGVFYANDQDVISGLSHARVVKRRKTQKKDHTYHGDDYL